MLSYFSKEWIPVSTIIKAELTILFTFFFTFSAINHAVNAVVNKNYKPAKCGLLV